MKDYYELLEVSKNASTDTIKKVFRILIKKNHPDLFEGEEKLKAEEKVKQLNEAYEVLINKESREKYDIEFNEYINRDNNALQTLIEENEYLKNVIKEKNQLIKEFLSDMGISTNGLEENISRSEYISENDTNIDMTEGYNSYKREERIRRIIYMLTMIIIGAIVLWAVTGINVFELFIEIFKTMF